MIPDDLAVDDVLRISVEAVSDGPQSSDVQRQITAKVVSITRYPNKWEVILARSAKENVKVFSTDVRCFVVDDYGYKEDGVVTAIKRVRRAGE